MITEASIACFENRAIRNSIFIDPIKRDILADLAAKADITSYPLRGCSSSMKKIAVRANKRDGLEYSDLLQGAKIIFNIRADGQNVGSFRAIRHLNACL